MLSTFPPTGIWQTAYARSDASGALCRVTKQSTESSVAIPVISWYCGGHGSLRHCATARSIERNGRTIRASKRRRRGMDISERTEERKEGKTKIGDQRCRAAEQEQQMGCQCSAASQSHLPYNTKGTPEPDVPSLLSGLHYSYSCRCGAIGGVARGLLRRSGICGSLGMRFAGWLILFGMIRCSIFCWFISSPPVDAGIGPPM